MSAIDRGMLERVLDKYIPQLKAGGVVFVKHPEFEMSTASEGRIYRYMRVVRQHLRVLRKSLPPEEEPLIEVARNFDADILAICLGTVPPHVNDV